MRVRREVPSKCANITFFHARAGPASPAPRAAPDRPAPARFLRQRVGVVRGARGGRELAAQPPPRPPPARPQPSSRDRVTLLRMKNYIPFDLISSLNWLFENDRSHARPFGVAA